ncbi:hypothetical protein HaLaN_11414 [Haematococcus lacustris]|uniref:Uncharacterized protein n=1 Tax=Haematococcus lacustris TaxID=44745 RepID=A0A699ZHU7_HAELA|nr:hypothetical protein HaLaN_11414 [Haematococcus lacustris]
MTGYFNNFDDDWQPDGTQPDGMQPDGSQPDGTQPDGTQPDASQPGGSRVDRDRALMTNVAAHTVASEPFKRRDNYKPFWDLVQQECTSRDSSFALSPPQCKDKYKYAKKGVSSVIAYHNGKGPPRRGASPPAPRTRAHEQQTQTRPRQPREHLLPDVTGNHQGSGKRLLRKSDDRRGHSNRGAEDRPTLSNGRALKPELGNALGKGCG